MRFRQLINDYINNGAQVVLTESSKKSYTRRLPPIVKYFKKHFGGATHEQLTVDNIRAFQRWRDDQIGNTSKEKEYRIFCLMIKRALVNKLIAEDFSTQIYKYRASQTNKSKTIIPPEKLQETFAKAKRYIKGKKYIAFYLGHVLMLRPAELVNLKMEDINFEDMTIRVRGTKTNESDDTLPLPEEAADLLRPYVYGRGDLFRYGYGWLVNVYKYLSDWCGLFDGNITPQKARKNMCSYLLYKGYDIKTVQTLGRWKSPNVLLSVYAQASEKQMKKAVNALKIDI